MGRAQSVTELVAGLPPDFRLQVREFVETFITKRGRQRRRPSFNWAGALTELGDSYTSVDLQHQIGELRGPL
jgi:hypothetical protein